MSKVRETSKRKIKENEQRDVILGAICDEYTPCDTNTLLAVGDKAFTERNVINLMVTSKHPRFQWFTADEARELVTNGLKYVDWASTDQNVEPDVVIASAGTEPTTEAMAAVSILHKAFPELKIRTINVVDILRLRSPEIDPRGLSNEEFDGYFTKDKPVIFAFHGFEDLLQTTVIIIIYTLMDTVKKATLPRRSICGS